MASLTIATTALMVAPAAVAAPEPSAASVRAGADHQHAHVSAAFAELRQLIDRLEGEGGITFSGARRMLAVLDLAETYYDRGYNQRAILSLGSFKQVAEDPLRVPSDAARAELIAAADELIALLR